MSLSIKTGLTSSFIFEFSLITILLFQSWECSAYVSFVLLEHSEGDMFTITLPYYSMSKEKSKISFKLSKLNADVFVIIKAVTGNRFRPYIFFNFWSLRFSFLTVYENIVASLGQSASDAIYRLAVDDALLLIAIQLLVSLQGLKTTVIIDKIQCSCSM